MSVDFRKYDREKLEKLTTARLERLNSYWSDKWRSNPSQRNSKFATFLSRLDVVITDRKYDPDYEDELRWHNILCPPPKL